LRRRWGSGAGGEVWRQIFREYAAAEKVVLQSGRLSRLAHYRRFLDSLMNSGGKFL
jgi:hypothetical protein